MAVDELPIPDKLLLSPETRIIQGKREFMAAGATLLVERLSNGDVIKTPRDESNREGFTEDLITEVKVYQLLGEHFRLVKLRSWDPLQYTITMSICHMARCNKRKL